MGLNVTVQRVGYDKGMHNVNIVAQTTRTADDNGVLALDPMKPGLAERWEGIFGSHVGSLDKQFIQALTILKRHNADHKRIGSKSELPLLGETLTAYTVNEGVLGSVTYIYNGPDTIDDRAVVRFLDEAKIASVNIGVQHVL